MNLRDYCKKEFEIENGKDPKGYAGMIESALLELVDTFSKQGHSGMSAGMITGRLNRILQFKPLTPLTGEESEWGTEASRNQNNRCSAVFRKEDGKAYYVDGKVFSDDGGKTWFTNKNSRVDIEFPYSVPDEPEYVYLNEKD